MSIISSIMREQTALYARTMERADTLAMHGATWIRLRDLLVKERSDWDLSTAMLDAAPQIAGMKILIARRAAIGEIYIGPDQLLRAMLYLCPCCGAELDHVPLCQHCTQAGCVKFLKRGWQHKEKTE